ncbi:hypothetical protein [Nocardia sp. alder85J]|uniref:hypothetical protein n=1 Tax=Nocardia sp. alder85J TaxID=2862949 RepID=UPI001CD8031E|nr:hypothetical protein [Nocardia sp. alder85J]MCX4093660.1 hypothetical protein [Nocardia sp. alder85J]
MAPDWDDRDDEEDRGSDWEGIGSEAEERHAVVRFEGDKVKIAVRDAAIETVVTMSAAEARELSRLLSLAADRAQRDQERWHRRRMQLERDRERALERGIW